MGDHSFKLRNTDWKAIQKVQKAMEAKGFVKPSKADAVRYALKWAATGENAK